MPNNSNAVTTSDLPAWYQDYTKNLGMQAMNIAQSNNQQPLPMQSVAGFNSDQTAAFDAVRQNQGVWQPAMQQAAETNAQIPDTAAQFIDYAQGAAGAPAQSWVDPGVAQKYMSPYTSAVVDNIARLGQRNWEDNIMPGVNSSMLGSGQFGSTRNADILGRAGVNAANDITGQQSTALQAGYNAAAGIFGNDANRAQSQSQLQANTALAGANAATNALNTASGNWGALAKNWQGLQNTDTQGLLNIGNQEQQFQQGALGTAYQNAMNTRSDPWTQLNNASGVINGIRLPSTSTTSSSATQGAAPSGLSAAAIAALTAAGLLNPDGSFK